MVTAIDTNVLLDITIPNPAFVKWSRKAIEKAAASGALVICDVVYAELCCQFDAQADCDRFLEDFSIQVEALDRNALFAASRAQTKYRSRAGKQNRIVADFLIAAHASMQASQLLTRDRGFHKTYFTNLKVVNPV